VKTVSIKNNIRKFNGSFMVKVVTYHI